MIYSIEAIARSCHEANRAYCAMLGDNSHAPWEESPPWQRDSAMAGVRAIQANMNLEPGHSHQNWLAHKEAEGWVYGPVKNPEADPPTHPCMVPFKELPTDQQLKDVLFLAVAKSMLL